jgi:phospholipid/cholesterol/gamma-HCH transport system substrate-binding protein
MKTLGTEFKVGLFTLVALSTLVYMFFVLSPDSFESGKRNNYYTILSDAAGIIPKTHVKTNGVIIGKVKDVRLDVNMTRIDMEIDVAVKIPVGSHIEVRTRGLLGDVFLEIIRPEDTGQYVPKGGMIPKSEGTTDMQAVLALAGSIGRDVKKITGVLADVMGSDSGKESIADILDNIHDGTFDLKKTMAALRGAVGDRPEDVKSIVANIKEFTQGLREVLDEGNRQKLQHIIASFDESMADVKGASKNIRLISEKVERGEGTIGKLLSDESTIAEIEGAIKDLREVLSPVKKLEVGVEYRGEFRNDNSGQNYFNMVFRTRPDRYYLLGATDVQNEQVDRTTKTITEEPTVDDDPTTTQTREIIQDRKALRYNLQFAKRFGPVGLRFGLFESTGGIASDLYLFRDRMRLSAEAFDWKTKDNEYRRVAHLKAYASVLFFNHVSAIAGVDDITRLDPATGKEIKTPKYYFGAGLSFNDNDLRSLFGAAALAR